MLRVGLTGGIACGKSHVLRRLAARGLATLDLDAVAHGLMAPGGAAYEDVVAAFGRGILAPDGAVDRKALGTRVFGDAAARARLDALVHPRVRAEEARWAAALAGGGGAVLVSDAALLVEAGAHLRFDRLVVVHCPPAEQLLRLVRRDGIPEDAALARVSAQMPVEEKRRYAHSEIDTSGTVGETERAADALAEALLALAALPRPRHSVAGERRLGGLRQGAGVGPRGLDAVALLADAFEAAGSSFSRLARRLPPPARGRVPRGAAARSGPGPSPRGRPGRVGAAPGRTSPRCSPPRRRSRGSRTATRATSRARACCPRRPRRRGRRGGRVTALPEARVASRHPLAARGRAVASRRPGGRPCGAIPRTGPPRVPREGGGPRLGSRAGLAGFAATAWDEAAKLPAGWPPAARRLGESLAS